jgi:hypothetical protein
MEACIFYSVKPPCGDRPMAKWYFQIDGEEFGPVDAAFLKRIAASGRLKHEHKVRREDSKDWHLAKKVQGLFSTGQNESAPSPAAPAAMTKQAAPAAAATSAAPHPTRWYYAVDGQEVGPLELVDLKGLVAKGRLIPTQQLRQTDSSRWQSAQQLLPGLFATSDRAPEKLIPQKSNRVLIFALGCLSVPVVGLLLLFFVALIVGDTNPDFRERAKSRERPNSTEKPASSFTQADRPHAVTIDTTKLSEEARRFFETGESIGFDVEDVMAAATWAKIRQQQQRLANESGNQLVGNEVRNAIQGEMRRLKGTRVTWQLRVSEVSDNYIHFKGSAYGTSGTCEGLSIEEANG